MIKGAKLSPTGEYRYSLWRIWDESKPKCQFVMLNPSTADAYEDDPTIRRCIAYARDWGYGGIYVNNLCAYRATNPKDLLKATDPIGPFNETHIVTDAMECEEHILAWGNHGRQWKDSFFEAFDFINWKYLRKTKAGEPSHPLYLPKNLKPVLWENGDE